MFRSLVEASFYKRDERQSASSIRAIECSEIDTWTEDGALVLPALVLTHREWSEKIERRNVCAVPCCDSLEQVRSLQKEPKKLRKILRATRIQDPTALCALNGCSPLTLKAAGDWFTFSALSYL